MSNLPRESTLPPWVTSGEDGCWDAAPVPPLVVGVDAVGVSAGVAIAAVFCALRGPAFFLTGAFKSLPWRIWNSGSGLYSTGIGRRCLCQNLPGSRSFLRTVKKKTHKERLLTTKPTQ